MMPPKLSLAVIVGLLLCAFSANAEDSIPWLQNAITQLDDDAYRTRQAAAERLLQAALEESDSKNVRAALQQVRKDGSFEQRSTAHRLLQELAYRDSLKIEPSPEFIQQVGSTESARSMYQEMHDRFGKWIAMAQRGELDRAKWAERLPISSLSHDDYVGWTTLLHIETLGPSESDEARSLKIGMVLSHPAMGPTISQHTKPFGQEPVLALMIESYLRHQKSPLDRNLILAARRYERTRFLIEKSQSWIHDPEAPASSLVAIMLAMLSVAPEQLDEHLDRWSTDDRIAHVWQSVDSGPQKIKTRVRDVARAIELHRQGLDPREHGFNFLRADPWLVYAPYSLGFVEPTR
jgi:DNA-binding phage protein